MEPEEKEKRDTRVAKIFMQLVLLFFVIIAITSLVYAYLTKGKSLSFEIFFSSSVVAIVAWFLFSNIKKLERKKRKSQGKWLAQIEIQELSQK